VAGPVGRDPGYGALTPESREETGLFRREGGAVVSEHVPVESEIAVRHKAVFRVFLLGFLFLIELVGPVASTKFVRQQSKLGRPQPGWGWIARPLPRGG
jgi:hypothetical protein